MLLDRRDPLNMSTNKETSVVVHTKETKKAKARALKTELVASERKCMDLTGQAITLAQRLETIERHLGATSFAALITNTVNLDIVAHAQVLAASVRHGNDIDKLKEDNRRLSDLNTSLEQQVTELTKQLHEVEQKFAHESVIMVADMTSMRDEMKKISNVYEKLTMQLSARDYATKEERTLMKFIFKPVKKSVFSKPYHLRSLKVLKRFIQEEGKGNQDGCGDNAQSEYDKVPTSIKEDVKQRLAVVLAKNADIVESIETAKEGGNISAHASHCGIDDLIQYHIAEDDTDVADALIDIMRFMQDIAPDLL